MDKISFKDLIAEHMNRFRLTKVSDDIYDITPERGNVSQAGTAVTASVLNQMQDNISAAIAITRPVYAINPTSGSIVLISITDAALVQQSNLRIAIKPVVASTASTNYTLSINGGTAQPIVRPTGSASSYITTLKPNVVYELVLTIIGASIRWVCINYRDDLNPLSGMKMASGNVTISPVTAGTPVSVPITYPAGLFTTTPMICATALTSSPQTAAVGVITADQNGATIYGVRTTSTAAYGVAWIAVGV